MSEDPELKEIFRNWELKNTGKLTTEEMIRRNNKIKLHKEKDEKPLFEGQNKCKNLTKGN